MPSALFPTAKKMQLKFDQVTKSYGPVRALDGFSAELTDGIYALLGPNGAGKSTLMNILTDNLKQDSGQILFNGVDVRELGVRFREKIGFLPQHPGMYEHFSASNFLRYMCVLKGIDRRQIDREIEGALTAVDLSEVASRRISTFSGGMKQRLGLAQAVLGSPDVLILDEPTAGLDPKQRIEIRNYISRIASSKIVIIATHVVSDIEYIAKSIIMLKKGVIADFASPAELLGRIEGSVWNLHLKEEEAQDAINSHRVVSVTKDDTGVTVRVLSDRQPSEDATSVPPTLEDYYLTVFGTQEKTPKQGE